MPHELSRVELINILIRRQRFKTYLEIGVRTGATFNNIQVERKIGVDPNWSAATEKMTSDDFFASNEDTFDLVFIDGLHLWEVALRDVDNSLAKLNPGGIIILHDCMPIKYEHQRRHRVTRVWNGDVWKTLTTLRSRPNLDCAVLNCDEGLGIILPRQNTQPIKQQTLTWQDYCDRRDELLRVVDIPGIWKFLENAQEDKNAHT